MSGLVMEEPVLEAVPTRDARVVAEAVPDALAATGAIEALAALDALEAGVAIADPDSWAIRLENARFRSWFPGANGDAPVLERRLPGLDAGKARQRLERGRPYRYATEVAAGPRTTHVQVELRAEVVAGRPALIAEAHDISKQREAEYMLDSYSRMVERKTRELEQEKERVEKLLLNIMPRRVYDELQEFGTTTPQAFESAAVLMLDFVGFTDMAIASEPGPLIAELNDVFTSFDRIIERYRCERIKTIGDAYMAVSGLPEPDPEYAADLARAALRMRKFLERRNASSANRWQCRIGLGCGPAIGSIVGIQKYVYDIFGPSVNMAARLETLAEPGQILVCASTCEKIRDEFVLRPLGPVELKGFGTTEVFELVDEVRKGRV